METNLASKFKVIGVMSGTSLDGVDLALTDFSTIKNEWSFRLEKALTIPYPEKFKNLLQKGTELSAFELSHLDIALGEYIGKLIKENFDLKGVDLIASHGHTIFHQPEKGITLQIGDGKAIHALTQTPTLYDFRSADVALGGQGAPLVPIGDQLLFSEFTACLNLGGIANCSFQKDGQMIAYDIAPFNMVLNHLANEAGHVFDNGGQLARSGSLNKRLIEALDQLPYYSASIPKSLGYEDFITSWLPLISNEQIKVNDRLHSYIIHVAGKIALEINKFSQPHDKLLITGGGAFNQFFLETLAAEFVGEMVIPEKTIIEYKEAIIFGFMGVLKLLGKTNCLSFVTGASKDSSGGSSVGL